MNVPRYAALAAKLLGDQQSADAAARRPPGSGDFSARERGLATIERALAAKKRRQLRWATVAALGAVAAAGLSFFVLRPHDDSSGAVTPSPSIAIDGSPRGAGASVLTDAAERIPLQPGTHLLAGSRLETGPGGGANLSLSTGTRMSIESQSKLAVQSNDRVQRFSLSAGALEAHVAKLSLGERFIVSTPDAEVEVRGTAFRLGVLEAAAACSTTTRTQLVVHEGLVEVRAAGHVIRVPAGSRWPTDCAAMDAAEPSVVSPVEPGATGSLLRTPRQVPPEKEALPGAVPSPASSALAEQNDLFARAAAARRMGDIAGALQTYQHLISTYPNGALSENAAVERIRVLEATDGAGAKREAAAYLVRYPNGFARREAQSIVDSP